MLLTKAKAGLQCESMQVKQMDGELFWKVAGSKLGGRKDFWPHEKGPCVKSSNKKVLNLNEGLEWS